MSKKKITLRKEEVYIHKKQQNIGKAIISLRGIMAFFIRQIKSFFYKYYCNAISFIHKPQNSTTVKNSCAIFFAKFVNLWKTKDFKEPLLIFIRNQEVQEIIYKGLKHIYHCRSPPNYFNSLIYKNLKIKIWRKIK